MSQKKFEVRVFQHSPSVEGEDMRFWINGVETFAVNASAEYTDPTFAFMSLDIGDVGGGCGQGAV